MRREIMKKEKGEVGWKGMCVQPEHMGGTIILA